MNAKTLLIHPNDNIAVALKPLKAGENVTIGKISISINEYIFQKHKFAIAPLAKGDDVIMYGVIIGKTNQPIPAGNKITTSNIFHATSPIIQRKKINEWKKPDISIFEGRTFDGYHRKNGSVGTQNLWLIIPLVFCENRNIDILRSSLLEPLGYGNENMHSLDIGPLVNAYSTGSTSDDLSTIKLNKKGSPSRNSRVFPNVDGIKVLKHEGGCGGTPQDAVTLCRLLAGYINNPNVGGATVLSLGCQHSQARLLMDALHEFNPDIDKPVFILEQQESKSEHEFLEESLKKTFSGLIEINKVARQPSPISKLVLGLECGGSDGFSGISANPVLGHASDLLVACGGGAILAEFPELSGVEQELINRCRTETTSVKFISLMEVYERQATMVGSGFHSNPSPGNVRDGLITDAMKSAGAAKKGGSSPIVDVLDYTEQYNIEGLNLLCTPGNDVESTTGLAGSGANLIAFTTGLGTPTGNPVCPVVKISSNNELNNRMSDIIDFNTGEIIEGKVSVEEKGIALLEYLIEVASGRITTSAMDLGQDDFIPWKRGVSL